MKKQCRILMIEKMKQFKNLKVIVLLVLLVLLNTGCYTATLAPSEDNLRSKQLTPPAGKALVYFYLDGGPYALIDVTASLNGFKSRISDKTYMLWEVFPGEYLLTFEGGKLEIQCEANQIYYYCVSSASMFGETLGQASDATGRAKINEFSLVKWFKDIPAPPKTKVTSGEEVAAHITEPAEPEKVEVTARVRLDEAVGTTKQAGSPSTDSDRVDKEELKSTKASEKAQPTDSVVAEDTDSAPTKSAQLGKKSESTAIVKAVPPTSAPVPFAIRDPKFEAAYKGQCETDATIMSVEGNSFGAGGKISMRNGAFTLWCYGAKHTWKGRLTFADHVFDSDNESPLQFMVDKDKGYVYLGGKGSVTLPDGTVIQLPVEYTDGSAVAPAGISDAPSPEKRDDFPIAQQAKDSDKADTAESDEKDTEPPAQESGETDKPQPPAEVIGTIRLIMRKDSDVTVTEYLYSRYNPLQRTGSVTRDRFEYEPDADIKASLERAGFEVVSEDSNEPEDATLVVRYEEKKREPGLDSPTAYYFSFGLSHKTKGTLLEGGAKATGCDTAEELRNEPQLREIGSLVRKAFAQQVLKSAETPGPSPQAPMDAAETGPSNTGPASADPDGQVYDLGGIKIRMIAPDLSQTSTDYDVYGQPKEVVSGDGLLLLEYAYDGSFHEGAQVRFYLEVLEDGGECRLDVNLTERPLVLGSGEKFDSQTVDVELREGERYALAVPIHFGNSASTQHDASTKRVSMRRYTVRLAHGDEVLGTRSFEVPAWDSEIDSSPEAIDLEDPVDKNVDTIDPTEPFMVGESRLQITSVSLGASMLVPKGIAKDETVLTINVKVLAGDPELVGDCTGDFDIWTTNETGRKNSSRAATASVTETGEILSVKWYFGVPKDSQSLSLHFPSGVVVPLTPLLK